MSVRTATAWRMARHPATVTLARCLAVCAAAAVQAGLRARASGPACREGVKP